jgi:hypothetical protein
MWGIGAGMLFGVRSNAVKNIDDQKRLIG